MPSELLRVVVDTNVVVSAAIQRLGIPAAILATGIEGRFILCFSDDILREYREVLSRGKFSFPKKSIAALLNSIEQSGQHFSPAGPLSICTDADNKFLECAEASRADYVVTGNAKHFPSRHRTTGNCICH